MRCYNKQLWKDTGNIKQGEIPYQKREKKENPIETRFLETCE